MLVPVLVLVGMVATEDSLGVETGIELTTGEDTTIQELGVDQDRAHHNILFCKT